jgi:hypothetical protein
MIAAEFQHAHDQAALRADAMLIVKEEIVYRSIVHVMLGLVHESLEHWSRADVKEALSCEAISVPLSDYRRIVQAARAKMAGKYGRATA